MNLAKLEIVGIFPPVYTPLCKRCLLLNDSILSLISSQGIVENMPPDLRAIHNKLSDFLGVLNDRFGRSLQIQFFDATTPMGLWKTIRYRIKEYPAFIVNGKKITQRIQKIEEVVQEIGLELTP